MHGHHFKYSNECLQCTRDKTVPETSQKQQNDMHPVPYCTGMLTNLLLQIMYATQYRKHSGLCTLVIKDMSLVYHKTRILNSKT